MQYEGRSLMFLNRFIFNNNYKSEEDKIQLIDMKMYRSLRKAIKQEEILVYYQPQVDARSSKLIGVEALARWFNEDNGFIPPDIFIPLAEKTGLIFEIEDHILRTACNQNKKWQDKGYLPIFMSVNLSSYWFIQKDLIGKISQTLKETMLEGKWLRFEITERVVINNMEAAADVINKIKELGVGIELDDFGTGYSSFKYIKNFSVDVLKIEKAFVYNITNDFQRQVITKAIIDLAHNLGIKATVEGVETLEQLVLLKKQQCDVIQGYFFSKPLPEEEVEHMVKKGFFEMPE